MVTGGFSTAEVKTLNDLVEAERGVKITSMTTEHIANLRKSIAAFRNHPNEKERVHLNYQMSRLRVIIESHIKEVQLASSLTEDQRKNLVTELNLLRDDLTRGLTAGEMLTSPSAAVDRFSLLARENPGAAAAIGVGAPIALTTVFVAAWRSFRTPKQGETRIGSAWSTFWRGLLLTGAGAGIAGGLAYLGAPYLQNLREKTLKNTEAQKKGKETVANLDAEITKQIPVTDAALKAFRSDAATGSEGSINITLPAARDAVQAELKLLGNLSSLPAKRQKELKARVKLLNDALKEIGDVEKKRKDAAEAVKKGSETDKKVGEDAGKKAEEDAGKKKLEDEAAKKKLDDDAAKKKLEDDAEKKKLDDAAKKKVDDGKKKIEDDKKKAELEKKAKEQPTEAQLQAILQGVNNLPVRQFWFSRNPPLVFPWGNMQLSVGAGGFRLWREGIGWRTMNVNVVYTGSGQVQPLSDIYRYPGGIQLMTGGGTLIQTGTYWNPVPIQTSGPAVSNLFANILPATQQLAKSGSWSSETFRILTYDVRVDVTLS